MTIKFVRGKKCEMCGLEDERVLCIHHKDHNHSNNKPENKQVLCYNCHRLAHYGCIISESSEKTPDGLRKIIIFSKPIPEKILNWLFFRIGCYRGSQIGVNENGEPVSIKCLEELWKEMCYDLKNGECINEQK